jgi:hypothetical protein
MHPANTMDRVVRGMIDIRTFFERVDPGCRVPCACVTLVAVPSAQKVRLGVHHDAETGLK